MYAGKLVFAQVMEFAPWVLGNPRQAAITMNYQLRGFAR
jgi:hypothetical protein